MSKANLILTLIISFLGTLASCVTETKKPDNTVNLIQGKWELSKATRNGNIAPTLQGAFFEFMSDKMTTNFTGSEETTDFSYSDGKLNQTGGANNIEYIIDLVTNDSLMLSTNIRGYDFKMLLLKNESN